MAGYDSHLFIDIVIGEGARDCGVIEIDGEYFQILQGLNGKKVTLSICDEYIGVITLKQYLLELGLHQLIPILFQKQES